jgi:outer membrane biogenesis lipoprotein LolB
MKKFILVAVAAVSLTACAAQQPRVWHKDGATEEQFRRDQMSCRQYGMQSAQANGLAGNMFVEVWISDETTKCLQNLGYR